uniref:Uncharacterized protein n=1 Tax=Naegleria fowleri TaxID=5763 RepID=M1HE24_NAEFO|nr:hypothetical protein [Naegleria fowleri]
MIFQNLKRIERKVAIKGLSKYLLSFAAVVAVMIAVVCSRCDSPFCTRLEWQEKHFPIFHPSFSVHNISHKYTIVWKEEERSSEVLWMVKASTGWESFHVVVTMIHHGDAYSVVIVMIMTVEIFVFFSSL